MGHPIARTLSLEQQALIDILAEQWLARGRWPVFDYLNRTLARRVGADATETLSRLPIVRGSNSQSTYRLIVTERGAPVAQADQRVGLTIAGLAHHPNAVLAVSQLIGLIRYLAQADTELEPDPDRPVTLDVAAADLLTTRLRDQLRGWGPERLVQAVEHEPPLWGATQAEEGRFRVPAGRLSSFREVSDVEDYLERLITWFGADVPNPPAASPSPLSLVEALGYLDAVWRNRFGSALLGRVQPASASKLALPALSIDEFDSRLSALADVLGHLEIELSPEVEKEAAGEKSLVRLRRRIEPELEEGQRARLGEAIRTLQRIVRIRTGGQHSGLGSEMAASFRQLGLGYPPRDPSVAWESVRGAATGAVNAIREEIQVSGDVSN